MTRVGLRNFRMPPILTRPAETRKPHTRDLTATKRKETRATHGLKKLQLFPSCATRLHLSLFRQLFSKQCVNTSTAYSPPNRVAEKLSILGGSFVDAM